MASGQRDPDRQRGRKDKTSAEIAAREAREQGLPESVSDPAVLAKLIRLLNEVDDEDGSG